MAAGKYHLIIEQGATLNLEIQYKDSAGTPVDLTGYSGKMQIRSDYADNNPTTYITLSSSLAPDGTGLNFSGSNGTTTPTSPSTGDVWIDESNSEVDLTTMVIMGAY